jgi:hypothetical protein
MLERRLQLLLDEERYQRVAEAAREQRVSIAAVIRDAIDKSLAPGHRRRASAAAAILGAPPMDVPSGDGLLAELRELREARG